MHPQSQQPQYQQYQKQPEYQQITIEGITYNNFLQPLGQGTEGVVYKGQNIQTKEIVAIKEYKSRNQNELKAIKEIKKHNFSHIIGIKGVHDDQNSYPIVVMEFANGEFYQFMQTSAYQNLSYDQKNEYFLQMVQGVEQLHELGLFHRDLKPENFVYIKDSNNRITIKLIDFGSVKETSNNMAKTSQVGTAYYTAPEVFGNYNKFYDKSVDIWELFGNSLEEIFNNIQTWQQPQIDKHIQDNQKIQRKEKNFIQRMLSKISFKRISLKDVLVMYNPQEIILIPYILPSQPIKFPQQPIQLPQQPIKFPQQPIKPPQQTAQLPQQPPQLPQQLPHHSKETQADNKERDQQTIQDEMQKQKDEELKQKMIEFEQKKQEEMEQMKREIERQLEQKSGAQQQNIENELKQKQLEDKKQSLIIQLKSIQNTINTFIQNLTQKQKIINEINTGDQKKQYLLNYINEELQKYQEKMNKNEQRLEQIKQAQNKENLQGHDIELAQESEQYIQDYNIIMENITKQQSLLEQQLKDKEQFDQQRKEQEQKLKKEQEQYQSLFQIVKSQFSQQSSQIKTISEQINFFQEIQQQIQGKEKIQDVIRQHSQISQDIQVLESQEKIILQFDSLQQINLYLQFISKLEEIQQTQNRLKFSIEEANKSIQLIDTQFTNEHYKQIDELNEKLDDFLDQFKYLSKHQKYANEIDQIINQIEVISGQLNSLKQLITKRTQVVYQQYNQTYDQIQQKLRDFQKQYNQLHEQICNDQQIEQKNIERIRKLKITQDLLDLFKQKMNELQNQIKNLIDNQYCNNKQTIDLINNKLKQIDQNIIEYQKQFDIFNQFNQLNSCEIINNQIIQLEQFQNKLSEVEVNEIEQVDQFKLIISKIRVENKNEQEREIVNLNNQLLNKYKQYSKSLKSIKFQFESIEFYQQMNEKKWILYNQLKQEIRILEDYSRVQHENTMLFKQALSDIKQGYQKQKIEDLLKKMQQTNRFKGCKLENVFNRVFNKKLELNFSLIDDNLIQNYEYLKKEEIQQSMEVNKINEKISNQQLSPQQLIELKEYILKICSTIDDLIMKIPQNNQIQEFNQVYQQNLESYQKVYALINYIKQYHLTRYYERRKESVNEQKKKQLNNNYYTKQFQSKLSVDQEEHTIKEKEAQDMLLRYEYALTDNQKMIAIEVMQKYKEQMEKQIVEIENKIKSQNFVKLKSNLKNQLVINEIMNNKQYYKITEFSQMLIFHIIKKENNKTTQQGQSNQY